MKFNKKFVSALTALLIAASSIASLSACSSGTTDTADTTGSGNSADTTAAVTDTAETAPADPIDALPKEDFDGYNFRVLIGNSNLETVVYNNFNVETENGDVLNDAIYAANRSVEERFNAVLTQIASENTAGDSKKSITAGDDAFDTILTHQFELYPLTVDDGLINMYDIPYVDLDSDLWDQSMKEQMTLYGKLYYNTGSITLRDDGDVPSIIFNKKIWNERGLEDPYALVKDGQWTIEKMADLSSGVNTDLNGDGNLDHNDLWGLLSQYNFVNALFFGAGEHMVTNDGINLTITFGGDRAAAVIEKAMTLMTGGDVLMGERVQGVWATVMKMFAEDRLMMRTTAFGAIPRELRKMENDFGILPVPKFDEAQERHFTQANYNTPCAAVPVTVSDLDRTGVLLEAVTIENDRHVTPAFYEVSLKGKVVRDNESSEMLDIIFESKYYDIGCMFNIAGFNTLLQNQVKAGQNTFKSALDAVMTKAETEIADITVKFAD